MLRRGVCWNKKNKRWQAAINSSGKYLYLGSFTNEDDAAKQFDRAAIKLRGKKAKLNFEYQGVHEWTGGCCGSHACYLCPYVPCCSGRTSRRGVLTPSVLVPVM